MASSASLTSGVAGRYATALFEIGKEQATLDRIERDLDAVEAALAESADFREAIRSPVHSRADQADAMAALSARMELGPELGNTLGLMAKNRRLFVLPGLIASLKALIAADRGEVMAEVTAAKPLTEEQAGALAQSLKTSVGKAIKIKLTIDESLIGGLVVKVGSRMIDTSIRSKLASLQNVMKEVG